jgi:hypothetical protein
VYDVSDKLSLAVAVRSPYLKKSKSSSLFHYSSLQGNTDIRISADARNTYRMPLVIGAGLNGRLTEDIRFSADLSFFDWSQYEVEYFGENLERDFKNIFTIGFGLEIKNSISIAKTQIKAPFRVGVIYDPQPVKMESPTYGYLTMGSALFFKDFILDTGVGIGLGTGTGRTFTVLRFALSLIYQLSR